MTKYVGIRKENNMVIIDGYTTATTTLGVVRDVNRIVEKIPEIADQYTYPSNKEEAKECISPYNNDGYFFEIQDVPCACTFDEELDEVVGYDGRFNTYFYVGYVM